MMTPRKLYAILLEGWERIGTAETAKAVLLQGGRIHRILEIGTGGTLSTDVDLNAMALEAFKLRADEIVIAHNHPSGRREPSAEDDSFTERAAKVCEAVGVKLVDHLVITRREFFSYSLENRI